MDNQRYSELQERLSKVEQDIKEFIIETLKQDGRISLDLTQEESEDDNNYPVTSTLYGRHDNPQIKITDVYLDKQEQIYADGIDNETGEKRCQFHIYSEQYSDILYFIGHATN